MSKQNLSSLLKKREALELKIASAQAVEKRKIAILGWPEFARILALPDDVLRAGLADIARQNSMQN